MKRVEVTVIYPMNPLGNKVGGISTFLKNFVKYAPEYFKIRWVGITTNIRNKKINRWYRIKLEGREVDFIPLLRVRDENRRPSIPLTLKFSVALSLKRKLYGRKIINSILNFNRIETALPFIFNSNLKFLTIHGHSLDYYNPHSEVRWSKITSFYFLMERFIIKSFKHIFIVREDAVRYYHKKYPAIEGSVSFLPTWLDGEIFYPLDTQARKKKREQFIRAGSFSPEDKLILFAGRFEGQKDPVLLIKTFKAVLDRLPEARLLLIGKGSMKEKMVSLIKENRISDRVSFLGVLSQGQMADIMKICDLFLLTSAFEGMPRCLMEALGCGLPVVTTDAGEVKRVVKERISGKVINSRRPEVLSSGVVDVLQNEVYSDRKRVRSCIGEYFAQRVLERVYRKMEETAGEEKK